MQEMRITVYRYTRTIQDKYQAAPIITIELNELLVLFFTFNTVTKNLSIRKNNNVQNARIIKVKDDSKGKKKLLS